ncbi:cytochrome c551 [Bacillus xiapuensis]|uniref:cytochrome c551 n=1 Tax=Bacillus xiapuensis TaxID=2014075 RepID=UPI000C23F486|nr:cytochrome c [Bacillus xiapuensis]
MKFKKSLLALLMGSSVALAACGGGDEGANKPKEDNNNAGKETAAADGEAVYKQSCVSCHGENLEGSVGPALDKIGSKMSEQEIRDVIKKGQGSMPPNVVEGAEADAVAKWLAEKK